MRPSLRFEVFKRDSFKCQYCGRSAPDVLLQADHIKPVAEGGLDELMNLVTSCAACNIGKGARPLDDASAVTKSRLQLEALQERREQLDMMMRWMDSLRDIRQDTVSKLAEYWERHAPGWTLNDVGRAKVMKWVRKYSVEEICSAMDAAASYYLEYAKSGAVTQGSWEIAFAKIPGICLVRREEVAKPYLADLYYIRGILRRRVYVNERDVVPMLEAALTAGVDAEYLKRLAKSASWSAFRNEVYDLTAQAGAR